MNSFIHSSRYAGRGSRRNPAASLILRGHGLHHVLVPQLLQSVLKQRDRYVVSMHVHLPMYPTCTMPRDHLADIVRDSRRSKFRNATVPERVHHSRRIVEELPQTRRETAQVVRQAFPAPPLCKKLLHRWRDRQRLPDVREL